MQGRLGARRPSHITSATAAGSTAPVDPGALDLVLEQRTVRSLLQPVVDLRSGELVGYEALARGPAGGALEAPRALFAAARGAGRLPELERLCHEAALEAAAGVGWSSPLGLFVNVEPDGLDRATIAHHGAVWARARRRGPVVVELTERALVGSPADLLAGVDRLREAGCAIALDDVGADSRSLALMPFLAPEVIKLDLRLVQARPDGEIATIVHAVSAQAERTGAVVVAEGIETEAQLETALALGATLGQGYRFGRPAEAPPARPIALDALPAASQPVRMTQTPFDLVAEHAAVRIARKHLLIEIAAQLERQVAEMGDSGVLLATFEHARYFTHRQQRRYTRIADRVAFVAAFASGLDGVPAAGVRGQPLDDDEALRLEWDVAVVGAHFAALLVARDLGDPIEPDLDRRFEMAVTYDRDQAVAAARRLMARIQPAPGALGTIPGAP